MLRVVGWCTQSTSSSASRLSASGSRKHAQLRSWLAPPRPQLHELREVAARRADEQHLVRRRRARRPGARASASTTGGAGRRSCGARTGVGRPRSSARVATATSRFGTRYATTPRTSEPTAPSSSSVRDQLLAGRVRRVEDDDHGVDERAELDRLGRGEHRRADDDLDVEAGVQLGEARLGGGRRLDREATGALAGESVGSSVRPCTSRGSTSSPLDRPLAHEHLDVRRGLDREVLGEVGLVRPGEEGRPAGRRDRDGEVGADLVGAPDRRPRRRSGGGAGRCRGGARAGRAARGRRWLRRRPGRRATAGPPGAPARSARISTSGSLPAISMRSRRLRMRWSVRSRRSARPDAEDRRRGCRSR